MKKSTIFLSALVCVCVGVAQMGMLQTSTAQPAQPGYNQSLIQGKQNLKDKDYEAAEKDARQLLTLANTPEQTGDAMILLGEVLYNRKMYDQAIAQWNKALALTGLQDEDSVQDVAHLCLARSYASSNKFDKAIPHYEAVLANLDQNNGNEQSAVISLSLANAYYNTKQYDLAQEQLTKALDSSPDNPAFLMIGLARSGQVNMIQRKFKKSLEDFNRIVAIEEVVPGLKKYAQTQADGVSKLIPLQLEEGGLNASMPFRVKADHSFDGKIDAVIQALNDTIVEKVIFKIL